MNPSSKSLVQLAISYLAIRNRSRLEIEQYLSRKTSDINLIDATLTYLSDHQLLDDKTFGTQWAESRIRRYKGDIQIVQELKLKGLSPELCHQIIDAVDQPIWFEAMDNLLMKKKSRYQHLTGYPQKSKIYQLLHAGGYSSKLIDAFLRGKVE